jgi:type III restriction enzyme
MQLKNFQNNAIDKLKNTFYKLWGSHNRNIPLVFKSPTGSGKTIMMAEFLRRISGEASFDADKAFVWISVGDLAQQSKQKLEKYYNDGIPWTSCLDLNNLNNGHLKKNEVFFINWEKINTTNTENRRLRTESESSTTFDEFIKNTHEKNRELVLIVDESQLSLERDLAQEIVNIINPKIEIHISATPRNIPSIEEIGDFKAGFVRVKSEEVIAEGLIKESVKIMPKEEIEALDQNHIDLDELLIDLALEKQKTLKLAYEELGLNINPLILIQLPNDEQEKKATDGQNKLDFSKEYLIKNGINKSEIAVWLSNEKVNLDNIVKNSAIEKVLIFKQAAATGWDCPRAQILVSFREIKSPAFRIQVLGRILRMPEAKHYVNNLLNHSYCYTSYSKQEVSVEVDTDGVNKPKIYLSSINQGLNNIALKSVFLSRADYNDIGDSFTKTFIETANQYFGIGSNEETNIAINKLNKKGLDTSINSIQNHLIIDADIKIYDDFVNQLKAAETLDHESSYNDIKKFYDLLLYREIAHQDEQSKFGNVARSYGKLKSAMNVWLKQFIKTNPPLYAIVCSDLTKDASSALKVVIEQALIKYKPIRTKEVQDRVKKSKTDLVFSILPEYYYSDDYETYPANNYALDKCYLRSDQSSPEENFVLYLEQQNNIDWWYKNADNGREALAVEYEDKHGVLRLFYPDFIIRQGNKIGILDTKQGQTAESSTEKAQALYQYCQENKGTNIVGTLSQEVKGIFENGNLELWGGIVILATNGVFKYHNGDNYHYNPNQLDDWENLDLST